MAKIHRITGGEIKIGSISNPESFVAFHLSCDKNSSDEADALEAMKYFIGFLEKTGIRHEVYMRNTDNGDAPDGVKIYF